MESERFYEEIRVRYAETDMMGHAYYANYLVWFEQARAGFFRHRGMSYAEVEKLGFKLPVVEAWTKYKGEAKYEDVLRVYLWLGERKRTSFKVEYEILNETTGRVITEGYTWHVVVGEEFKPVAIPAFMLELFGLGEP